MSKYSFQILEWYRTVGEAYLQRTELGVSVETAQNELDNYHKYEKEGIVSNIWLSNKKLFMLN